MVALCQKVGGEDGERVEQRRNLGIYRQALLTNTPLLANRESRQAYVYFHLVVRLSRSRRLLKAQNALEIFTQGTAASTKALFSFTSVTVKSLSLSQSRYNLKCRVWWGSTYSYSTAPPLEAMIETRSTQQQGLSNNTTPVPAIVNGQSHTGITVGSTAFQQPPILQTAVSASRIVP